MITIKSMDTLKSIRFGYSFMGNNRTLKLRFKAETAQRIVNLIPQRLQEGLMFLVSKKGYAFIALVEPKDSEVWPVIENAIIQAKADSLRQTANQLEYGTPVQLNLGFE